MKIIIIWQSEYPWDVRIDKFVKTFVKLGHSVLVLANNKFNKDQFDEYLGAKVVRMPTYSIPHPFNKNWINNATKIINEYSPDLVMVRDLPLYLIGRKLALQKGIPVWFDMAEDYPATFLDMQRNLLEKLVFKNYYLGRVYEKYVISTADIISVVVDESYDRVIKIGSNPSRVFVISNVPEFDFAELSIDSIKNETRNMLSKQKDQTILLYEGNTDKKRGLETVLIAISIIKKQQPRKNIKFIIAGGKEDEINRLKRLAKDLGIENNFSCVGKLPYKYLPYIINEADICIVPHLKTLHTITTVPNKLFDYFALGKPVLVSDIPPLKRIVDKWECGHVYKSGDSNDLAEKILLMLDNESEREIIGRNAKKAFHEVYNWHNEEEKIINILQLIEGNA